MARSSEMRNRVPKEGSHVPWEEKLSALDTCAKECLQMESPADTQKMALLTAASWQPVF